MSNSSSASPLFDATGRDRLIAQLADIAFIPAQDAVASDDAIAHAYLDYYGINFAKTRPGLSHGFGALDTGGFRIATHYWLPANPTGTLVVIHGYYDHVGLFGRAIEFGLAQGKAVLAFDLPGHGLSSGERVAIDSFDQYADVLEALLTAAQPLLPAPYGALGQSTGGSVLLNYLWRYDAPRIAPRLQHIALCAPLVLPRAWGGGRIVYQLVHRFVTRVPRGRSRNSHNPDFLRFVDEQDCLQSHTLSVRWVGAMKAWNRQFRAFPSLPDKSVLVLQGTDDQTVAWRYNLRQIARKLPRARLYFIEGARHQLVNESDEYRQQVMAKLRDYFSAQP
ncbi:MAG TPA: alpha/beta hydrolase [Cellvibrio sp.]|nr:alpha/beta hydrolase [Cellvibrio sp.]